VAGSEKSSTDFPGIEAGFKPRSEVRFATLSLNAFFIARASEV
jgi:hypothetical protein